MPNYFRPTDVYPIMNQLVREISGQDDISVTDTTSFVSAGTSVLEAGYENVLNAISVLIARTIVAARPYSGKFKLINAETDAFDNRARKISFYAKPTQASGAFNTQLYTNLGAGLDDESGAGSQWEQNPSIPVEKYFFSSATYDFEHTEYIQQLKIAFTSEAEFLKFLNGMRTEIMNDMEQQKEAKGRALVLDRIAGTKLLVDKGELGAECAVNLTAEYNKEHGTSYTTQQLVYDHTVALLEFFLARIKNDSDMLTNRTALYHDPMTQQINSVDYNVLRHTPKGMQKLIYNSRFFNQIKLSLAEIFHPEMLDLPNGEDVQYWQSVTDPYKVAVKPALLENATSSAVEMDIVIGMLFDVDALMANIRYEGMTATPVNARHLYRNEFWHFLFSNWNDYSENGIIYYMSDSTTEYFTGDGVEDDFQLKATPTSVESVTVNGVEQTVTTNYTVSGDTVTFVTAPAADAIIQIIYK